MATRFKLTSREGSVEFVEVGDCVFVSNTLESLTFLIKDSEGGPFSVQSSGRGFSRDRRRRVSFISSESE